jgi:[acyl-carrier-protein] S-malonyltransferase
MAPAAREMSAALERTSFAPFAFPVIANATATPNSEPGRVRELLVRQIDGAVLWEQTISYMAEQGVTHALEIGAGKVLAGLVKRIDKRVRVLSVSDAQSIEQIGEFLG